MWKEGLRCDDSRRWMRLFWCVASPVCDVFAIVRDVATFVAAVAFYVHWCFRGSILSLVVSLSLLLLGRLSWLRGENLECRFDLYLHWNYRSNILWCPTSSEGFISSFYSRIWSIVSIIKRVLIRNSEFSPETDFYESINYIFYWVGGAATSSILGHSLQIPL